MATPAHGIGIALTVGSLRAFRSAKNAGPQNMANRSSERQPPLSHSVHTTASGAGFLGIALLGIILLGKVLLGGLKREETRFETGPVTADRMRRRRLFPRVGNFSAVRTISIRGFRFALLQGHDRRRGTSKGDVGTQWAGPITVAS
jgi:hypothetical protein